MFLNIKNKKMLVSVKVRNYSSKKIVLPKKFSIATIHRVSSVQMFDRYPTEHFEFYPQSLDVNTVSAQTPTKTESPRETWLPDVDLSHLEPAQHEKG